MSLMSNRLPHFTWFPMCSLQFTQLVQTSVCSSAEISYNAPIAAISEVVLGGVGLDSLDRLASNEWKRLHVVGGIRPIVFAALPFMLTTPTEERWVQGAGLVAPQFPRSPVMNFCHKRKECFQRLDVDRSGHRPPACRHSVRSLQSNLLAQTNKSVCCLIGRLQPIGRAGGRGGVRVLLSVTFEKQKVKMITIKSEGKKKRPCQFTSVLLIFR